MLHSKYGNGIVCSWSFLIGMICVCARIGKLLRAIFESLSIFKLISDCQTQPNMGGHGIVWKVEIEFKSKFNIKWIIFTLEALNQIICSRLPPKKKREEFLITKKQTECACSFSSDVCGDNLWIPSFGRTFSFSHFKSNDFLLNQRKKKHLVAFQMSWLRNIFMLSLTLSLSLWPMLNSVDWMSVDYVDR